MKLGKLNVKKGDILKGSARKGAIHKILFIREDDIDNFIGVMLTSSSKYPKNILIDNQFLKKKDEAGKTFKFPIKPTRFVQALLLKSTDWFPFEKVGEMTLEGINFVFDIVKEKEPHFWEEHK